MAQLKGISWPFRVEGKGLPAQAAGFDVIRSTLIAMLLTRKRSRVMRPGVGTNLWNFIFEVQGPVLIALIQKEISDCVYGQIPNIKILSIPVTEDKNKITVNVIYSVYGVKDETGDISYQR